MIRNSPIIDVLDGIIKVGQSMGYDMEGCSKDIERIIGFQGDAAGDFNEVRSEYERFGSIFSPYSARTFNHFIASSGFLDVKMEGYSFTWSHPSASKMSKLDRFLVSDGIFLTFPVITAVCLDRHLSDHRPIILKKIQTDFGPTPFRLYHSWFKRDGFDAMVEQAWLSFSHNDSNSLIRFKKKLQDLKKVIRVWIRDMNILKEGVKSSLTDKLVDIDKVLDNGVISDDMLLNSLELSRKLNELNQSDLKDAAQKAKVKWAIESDENSKNFHGIINKRPAVWDCGENKSPGPDGFTFDFFRHFWDLIGSDLCALSTVSSTVGPSREAAYDSIRWDFLLDVLHAFSVGSRWCSWIRGIFSSNMASILVNGSPTSEFLISCGLKQDDPLAPLLFILVMETLHISFARSAHDGVFKGLLIDDSMVLSHLFYADDVVFVGEWSDDNLANLVRIL
nr:RNA-directed DNA polymerase, eukaryota [Tanacetum cinerariifolium]